MILLAITPVMTGHGDLRRSHVGTINGNETVTAMKNQTFLSPSASEALGPIP